MPRLFRHPPYTPLVSHQFPCTVWLPGSSLSLTVYPSALVLSTGERFLLDLSCRFLEHTTRLNLLDNTVTIEGMTEKGFQRLIVQQATQGWILVPKKYDVDALWQGKKCAVQKNESLVFAVTPVVSPVKDKPRLVLSSPNNSNWDRLLEAKKWPTIVEQLYLIDSEPCSVHSFNNIDELLSKGFSGMVVPRVGPEMQALWGQDFWPEDSFQRNLCCFRSSLRSRFIQEKGDSLLLLPQLPREFVAGQLLDETAFNGALHFSFDWRKERVRRILIFPQDDVTCALVIPGAHSCRLRVLGHKVVCQETVGHVRTFKKDKRYLLDNFVR